MELLYRLENFEGPLDVLLKLIREKKMDLRNLDIKSLASQYFEIVSNYESTDLDEIAEHLVMATYLLELKSRYIIPTLEDLNDPNRLDLERDLLIKRLIEYKLYKDVVPILQEKFELNKLMFGVPNTFDLLGLPKTREMELPKLVEPEKLFEAFMEYMETETIEDNPPVVIHVKELSPFEVENELFAFGTDVGREFLLSEFVSKHPDHNFPVQFHAMSFVAALNLVKENRIIYRQNSFQDDISLKVV